MAEGTRQRCCWGIGVLILLNVYGSWSTLPFAF